MHDALWFLCWAFGIMGTGLLAWLLVTKGPKYVWNLLFGEVEA